MSSVIAMSLLLATDAGAGLPSFVQGEGTTWAEPSEWGTASMVGWEEKREGHTARVYVARGTKRKRVDAVFSEWRRNHGCTTTIQKAPRLPNLKETVTFSGSCKSGDVFATAFAIVNGVGYEFHVDARLGDQQRLLQALAVLLGEVRAL